MIYEFDWAVYILVILGYSLLVSWYVPKRYYSLSNVLFGLASLWYGLSVGVDFLGMGLSLNKVVPGIVLGATISLPIAIACLAGAFVPVIGHLFTDGPKKRPTLTHALYQLGFRIPFATALSEEVVFRGVLLGILLQSTTPLKATLIASLVYGIWHILPTLQSVQSNDAFKSLIGAKKRHHLGSVLVTLVMTFVLGLAFSWLRIRSGSIIAPWIVHASINGFSVAGGYLVVWLRRATH